MAAALVAFANTDGGQLIFGVDKNRQILGVDDADRVMRDVDNVAANNCEPPITVIQEALFQKKRPSRGKHPNTQAAQQKPVIVVNIPKGDMRPYRTNRGLYFIRTTSGRSQASREELLQLFQASKSLKPLCCVSMSLILTSVRSIIICNQPARLSSRIVASKYWKVGACWCEAIRRLLV